MRASHADAMGAARLGEPELALQLLLNDTEGTTCVEITVSTQYFGEVYWRALFP